MTTTGRWPPPRPRVDPTAAAAGLGPARSWPQLAAEAGLRRIHMVAWRDLDDPEAGGSELHAHMVAARWAAAGLDVTFRTSAVPGAPAALDPRRLPGAAPFGPLRRLPGRGLGGHPHGAPTRRRAGRDLERHALPLAAVVPGAAHRLPAPRARRDVGHGPAAGAGPAGQRHGAPGGAALLPAQPDRDALGVLADRDRRACSACPRRTCRSRPPGVDARFTPGRPPFAHAAWWWPSAAWCR